MFQPEIVRMLHNQCTGSHKVLRGIAFITDKLDIPWDLGTDLIFSGEDSTPCAACDFLDLPSPTMDPSQKKVSPLPDWFRFDAHMLVPRPLPWPD